MAPASPSEEIDLYEILSVSRTATRSEIKKAYHKAALTSHPDKFPPEERESAEIKFKAVSQAYEILHDVERREMYDTHGMAAFESGSGGASGDGMGSDLDDLLARMFGMNTGPSMNGRRSGPRKGPSEEQEYDISLEELYKGKSTKFTSTKDVICELCHGSGGKEKAKAKSCGTCGGKGIRIGLRQVGPGLVTQEQLPCTTCKGRGSFYIEKDKCKKCKGTRVISTKKLLELYVPRGAREGEKIVLSGEADQVPDQEPGDIIFTVKEKPHEIFSRAGQDLSTAITVSLQEALTGINRTVMKHLDGRGLKLDTLTSGKVLRPGEILLVEGEGMPIRKSDSKGDLYIEIKVDFPEDGWLKDPKASQQLQNMLGGHTQIPIIVADSEEDIHYRVVENKEGFGADSDDPRAANAEWEDEDDEDGPQEQQCAQQ